MAITKTNSSFKTKMGTEPDTLGLVPERGALVFSIADGGPVVADGFNWLTFAPAFDGIALTGTLFPNAMVAATPVEPASYFDALVYNLGTALTPSIPGQTVTINTDGHYRINWAFTAQSNVTATQLSFDVAINGTPTGSPVVLQLPVAGTPLRFSGSLVIPGLVATDVLTLWIETDKTCQLNRGNQAVGISLL